MTKSKNKFKYVLIQLNEKISKYVVSPNNISL